MVAHSLGRVRENPSALGLRYHPFSGERPPQGPIPHYCFKLLSAMTLKPGEEVFPGKAIIQRHKAPVVKSGAVTQQREGIFQRSVAQSERLFLNEERMELLVWHQPLFLCSVLQENNDGVNLSASAHANTPNRTQQNLPMKFQRGDEQTAEDI